MKYATGRDADDRDRILVVRHPFSLIQMLSPNIQVVQSINEWKSPPTYQQEIRLNQLTSECSQAMHLGLEWAKYGSFRVEKRKLQRFSVLKQQCI